MKNGLSPSHIDTAVRSAFPIIDKYIGDAVMALFNVPLRYEDHARRAILAATELESALQDLGARFGLSLQASVGISTGYARVGRLGSEDSKDYTAIGDVGQSRRSPSSQGWAGEILIGEVSYTKHSAEFLEAKTEQLLLKGFREPLTAYRFHGKGDTHPPDDVLTTPLREKTSLGTVIFGVLGALARYRP